MTLMIFAARRAVCICRRFCLRERCGYAFIYATPRFMTPAQRMTRRLAAIAKDAEARAARGERRVRFSALRQTSDAARCRYARGRAILICAA
jgi:hypothetical protein